MPLRRDNDLRQMHQQQQQQEFNDRRASETYNPVRELKTIE